MDLQAVFGLRECGGKEKKVTCIGGARNFDKIANLMKIVAEVEVELTSLMESNGSWVQILLKHFFFLPKKTILTLRRSSTC